MHENQKLRTQIVEYKAEHEAEQVIGWENGKSKLAYDTKQTTHTTL